MYFVKERNYISKLLNIYLISQRRYWVFLLENARISTEQNYVQVGNMRCARGEMNKK